MTCTRCGQTVPEGATECSACGAGLAGDNPTMTGYGAGTGDRSGPGGDRTLTTGGFAAAATGPYTGSPAARFAPGTLLGKRYEIVAVLGEGGMGTVYKARDLELGRLVALKVIRPEMASRPEILERFKREILLASQVTHNNVLRIHDFGEAGEVRFIRPGAADRRGAAGGARRRHRAPRPEAAERLGRRGGERLHRRFRHLPLARRGRHDDRDRRRARHGRLHVARAGARRDAGPPRRHLLVRRHALRDVHGRPPVPRQQRAFRDDEAAA
ncbi:MAG: hypothetical protein DMF51_06590 [Acidobacteria bacterium]|nr:MAG: hypothetical protein DMF51_06590 [Acidobacteriota bacterium]